MLIIERYWYGQRMYTRSTTYAMNHTSWCEYNWQLIFFAGRSEGGMIHFSFLLSVINARANHDAVRMLPGLSGVSKQLEDETEFKSFASSL